MKEHFGEMQDGEGEKSNLHPKLTTDTGSEVHRGGTVTSRAQQVSLPPYLLKLCTPAVLGGTNSKALSCQLCPTYLCAWLVLCCLQKYKLEPDIYYANYHYMINTLQKLWTLLTYKERIQL